MTTFAVPVLANAPAPTDVDCAKTAATGKSALPAELSCAGWRLLTIPGKTPAQYSARGPSAIGISAENAVAFLYRPIAINMGPKRRLGWRWRVDEAVPDTDLSRAGEDDRSLAIHLVFPVDWNRLPFWERIRLGLRQAFAPPLARKVLTYVWGGKQARGTILPNPHLDPHGRIIVLRSGAVPTGRWLMEEIDILADFRSAFGYSPPAPVFVAISADSDDTGSRSRGVIAELVFAG